MSTQFTQPSNPNRISGQDSDHKFEAMNSSDEERTHFSVISRRLKKRRKTNSSLVSNPFGSIPSSDYSPSKTLLGSENNGAFDDDEIAGEHTSRRRKSQQVPEADLLARQRCYDYLHTAIDAVWAEYCDSTAYAESLKYMPHSPVSEQEDSIFLSSGEEDETACSSGKGRTVSFNAGKGHQRSESISMQPQSQSLMRQKKRLLDAKYYLSHFVGAPDTHASATFWRVWDQLKYSTVELVEGDDDDADEVIDDLEAGRFYYQ